MDSIEFAKEYLTQEKLDEAVALLHRNGIPATLDGKLLMIPSSDVEVASELLAGDGFMFASFGHSPEPAPEKSSRMLTSVVYYLYGEGISFRKVKITRETRTRIFTEEGTSVEKKTLNTPRLGSVSHYPYIMVNMVDADEAALRAKLREWFDQKAEEICPTK